MYQKFNESKKRWEKYDKNDVLLSTKAKEGKYVNIPTYEEYVELQSENVDTSTENLDTSTEKVDTSSEKVDTSSEKVSKTEIKTESKPETKTLKEWLSINNLELLVDRPFTDNKISSGSQITKEKFDNLIKKCSVRNIF
jgi:hypothetical protein